MSHDQQGDPMPIPGPGPIKKGMSTDTKVILGCLAAFLAVCFLSCGGCLMIGYFAQQEIQKNIARIERVNKLEAEVTSDFLIMNAGMPYTVPDDLIITKKRLMKYLALRGNLRSAFTLNPEIKVELARWDAKVGPETAADITEDFSNEEAVLQIKKRLVEVFEAAEMSKAEYDFLTRLIYVTWYPKNGGPAASKYLDTVEGPLPKETTSLLKSNIKDIDAAKSLGLDRFLRNDRDVDEIQAASDELEKAMKELKALIDE